MFLVLGILAILIMAVVVAASLGVITGRAEVLALTGLIVALGFPIIISDLRKRLRESRKSGGK